LSLICSGLLFKDSFNSSLHEKLNKDVMTVEEAQKATREQNFEQTRASKLLFGDVKAKEETGKGAEKKKSSEEKKEREEARPKPEEETSKDEFDAILNQIEDEKAGEEAVKAQYDEELNEAKKKEEKNYSIQQANPTELRLGIRTELEHGDMELDKAKEIAYKNIAKDPIYYTTLKLSGVEAHPKKVKGEKVAPAKKSKKESAQLVDLVNGMQKVKMPKADEKKKD
jgi:hypothetical protein